MDLDDEELNVTKNGDIQEMYDGDLDKDIRILESHCKDSEKLFDAFGDNCFDIHDVKRIRNLISGLKYYRKKAERNNSDSRRKHSL